MRTSLAALVDCIVRVSYHLATICVGAVFALTLFEIVMRSSGHPTLWGPDLASFFFCGAIFLAFPHLTSRGGNVAITLVPDMMGERARTHITRATSAIAAGVCFFTAYICFKVLMTQFQQGITTVSGLVVPKWPLMAIIFTGILLAGIVQLLAIFAPPQPPAETRQV